MTTFWDTPRWHDYERAYGDTPGARATLLAHADWETQVVDLSLHEQLLWHGLRHSYRPLINKVKREYVLSIPALSFSATARAMHLRAAGRETRAEATWAMMDEWAAEEKGIWAQALTRDTATPVGYAYAVCYGQWAYYFSAVAERPNIGHALVWQLMVECRKRGLKWFEVGWHERSTDTDKERSICFFRRGFGGHVIPAARAPQLQRAT